MTKTARVVLQDLEHAIDKHTPDLAGEGFRISWFTIVSLLRAIGHVLAKVDSQRSPALAMAIDIKWNELQKSKPSPDIFWEFIEPERNRFLKTYVHSIKRTWNLSMYEEDGSPSPALTIIDVGRSSGLSFAHPAPNLKSKIESGTFAGEYELRVARRASAWWREYLDDVDNLAKQLHDRA